MTLVCFILWLMLNGRMTAEVFFAGIVVSVSLDMFMRRALGIKFRRQLPSGASISLFLRLLPEALLYVAILVREIVAANVAMIRMILSPVIDVEPCLVRMRTKLKSAAARAALANSVTLTPGTITVELKDDMLLVHALNRDMARGLNNSDFERILLRMESLAERASPAGAAESGWEAASHA